MTHNTSEATLAHVRLPIHLVDRIGSRLKFGQESHEIGWEEEKVAEVGTACNLGDS